MMTILHNQNNPPALTDVTLNFTSDAKLMMQSARGKKMYIATPSEHATSASMLNSGKFVLYNQ